MSRRMYRAIVTRAPDSYVHPWMWDRWNDKPRVESLRLVKMRVGQSRIYHGRAAAEMRARLWRMAGCEVRIDRSEPLVWVEGEGA